MLANPEHRQTDLGPAYKDKLRSLEFYRLKSQTEICSVQAWIAVKVSWPISWWHPTDGATLAKMPDRDTNCCLVPVVDMVWR